MNRWQILDAGTNQIATSAIILAPTANQAVVTAIQVAGLDPTRGYVAKRCGCDA